MEFLNSKFNFWINDSIVKQYESSTEFIMLEESLIKTINFLESRYTVILAYDYFTKPSGKRDHDMLFKVSHYGKEIMWVYFIYSKREKYISLEVDNDTVAGIKMRLSGFESLKERYYKNYPTLKLRFRSYEQIEQSLIEICDCLDGMSVSNTEDINSPLKPKGIIRNNDGRIQCICGRCGMSFYKSPRCPECGQLILYDSDSSPKTSKRILRVGDDVSRLRIYEIINRYFAENYSAWMKASYNINNDYWAWFPTITSGNVRPGGSYGGNAMWSNTLSPDMKTVISMNHDATIDDIPKSERNNNIKRKNILIFGRINGTFKFLGVFDDKLVLENKTLTYRHDRLAKGIDLDTFQLIDED